MTSPIDRPVPDPGPDVRAAIAALRLRLRAPSASGDDRRALRRLVDRLRRTADVGTDEQVRMALEWLRSPLVPKESAGRPADGVCDVKAKAGGLE